MTHPTDPLREAADYIDALISAQGEILLEGQSDPCDIVMRARAALAAMDTPKGGGEC